MKKLIPAIVMLLVSAVVLSTASYAWFTVSANVTADGMKVTASAPTSVVISSVTAGDGKYGYAYDVWSSSINFATADNTNKLYAASSTTGVTFVAPEECVDVSGSAKPGTKFDTVVNAETGTKYYVDYTFAIKNTSPDEDVYLEINSINLTGYALKEAVRFAIFVDNGEKAETPVAVGVYNPGSSAYVNVNGVEADGPISGTIAAATGDDLTAWNAAAMGTNFTYTANTKDIVVLEKATQETVETDDEGNATATKAVDNAHIITVRIWFEGQSAACISDYAGQNVGLSIQFKVGNED